MIFFDIETIPSETAIQSKTWKRYLEKHHDKTDSYAGLLPPFGQIIAIAAINSNQYANQYGYNVSRFSVIDASEKKVLTDFSSWLRESKEVTLCGHGIKGFDIPFLITRFIHHGIALPNVFQITGKKPWEIQHKDTGEIAKFGGWNNISLDALCFLLNIETPKSGIDGSKVWDAWKSKRYIDIQEYCEKDVEAVMECYFSLKKIIKGL